MVSEDKPKKTVALEYSFGRRANASTGSKDIVHVWELAGGLKLKELVSVPFANERLPKTIIALVVDLSNVRSQGFATMPRVKLSSFSVMLA